MASRAFTRELKQNTEDSHQVSPGVVLTFLRWSNRDPLRYPSIDSRQTRRPLVVENDCVQATITETKNGLNGSAAFTLLSGDINYRTAIAPGDFVFVNMLNWTESTDDTIVTVKGIAKRARALQPINRFGDGFKGLYKVQAVRKGLITEADGKKRLVFFIQAYSFTEYNNKMYFNPFLLTAGDKSNDTLFVTRISDQWNKIVGRKSERNIQNILKLFVTAFLGEGISNEGKKIKGILKSPNDLFYIPEEVGRLLNIKGAKKAADVYTYLMGIQKYNNTSGKATPANGFNPTLSKVTGRFLETASQIDGISVVKPEYWNQKQVWSIMRQYLNEVLNEMYTTHRVDHLGNVMPTVVMRQKPFTTEHYSGPLSRNSTRFFNLPRWKISPEIVMQDLNLGTDEAARINFVQIFGRSIIINNSGNISDQIAKGNYVFDRKDIERNGLKPYIVTSNFDFPENRDPKGSKAPQWTSLIADMLIGGHLKESGTMPLVGIQDPITVGDNVEFDGIVYHIESVTHNFQNMPNGPKSFRTNLTLTNGVDLRSNEQAPFYPEMQFTDAYTQKLDDYKFNKILPGFSDAQNIPGRDRGEEVKETKELSYDPLKRRRRE